MIRQQQVLDGLHYPHLLDAIFEYSSPAVLAAASQVCQQWRSIVKHMLHQVFMIARAAGSPFGGLFLELKSGREFNILTFSKEEQRGIYLLLTLCETLYSTILCHDGFGPEHPFNYRCFSNVKVVLTFLEFNAGIQTLRIGTPSAPTPLCDCGLLLQWPNASRAVLTIHRLDAFWDWRQGSHFAVRHFESLTLIYLPEPNMIDPNWDEGCEKHWHHFDRLIRLAWSLGVIVTIVHAAKLDELGRDPLILGGPAREPREKGNDSAVESLRWRATRAVLDDTRHYPPGPVCPVQFITVDEYKALEGESG